MVPPVVNPLRLYTELLLSPTKVLEFEEFSGLGPKTSIKEISDMWIRSFQRQEWTIVVVDPLDFVDSLTAKSTDTTKRGHHGNFKSWSRETYQQFGQSILHTSNTLLIIEGKHEDLPGFYEAFDRVVLVTAPPFVPLATG